jgi:hypothetical protein
MSPPAAAPILSFLRPPVRGPAAPGAERPESVVPIDDPTALGRPHAGRAPVRGTARSLFPGRADACGGRPASASRPAGRRRLHCLVLLAPSAMRREDSVAARGPFRATCEARCRRISGRPGQSLGTAGGSGQLAGQAREETSGHRGRADALGDGTDVVPVESLLEEEPSSTSTRSLRTKNVPRSTSPDRTPLERSLSHYSRLPAHHRSS